MTVLENDVLNAIERAAKKYVESKKKIDWEQRRYEIARDAITSTYFGGNNGTPLMWQKKDEKTFAEMAEYAVQMADALIAELRKGDAEKKQ